MAFRFLPVYHQIRRSIALARLSHAPCRYLRVPGAIEGGTGGGAGARDSFMRATGRVATRSAASRHERAGSWRWRTEERVRGKDRTVPRSTAGLVKRLRGKPGAAETRRRRRPRRRAGMTRSGLGPGVEILPHDGGTLPHHPDPLPIRPRARHVENGKTLGPENTAYTCIDTRRKRQE